MRPRNARLAATTLVLALAALVLPACGGDEDGGADTGGTTPTVTAGPSTVAVTLQEFAVSADPASVPAGSVTFDVTNDGPDDVHEFVVIATDLGPTDLPTDQDGAVEEGGEGMEVVDEIEDLAVGDTAELAVTLEAGSYVLLCNIYSADEQEAHYAEGMRVAFTVE